MTGRRQYRGHHPGTVFEAQLDPLAEQRAIQRGAIALVETVTPALEPRSFRLPSDWPVRVNEQGAHVASRT